MQKPRSNERGFYTENNRLSGGFALFLFRLHGGGFFLPGGRDETHRDYAGNNAGEIHAFPAEVLADVSRAPKREKYAIRRNVHFRPGVAAHSKTERIRALPVFGSFFGFTSAKSP